MMNKGGVARYQHPICSMGNIYQKSNLDVVDIFENIFEVAPMQLIVNDSNKSFQP
jgi:hypothetical protein